MKLIILSFLFLLASSCGTVKESSIKMTSLNARLNSLSAIRPVFQIIRQASIRDKRPELPAPFGLAVYFKRPDKDADWRWSKEDRESFLNTVALKKSVKNSFELINTSGKDENL